MEPYIEIIKLGVVGLVSGLFSAFIATRGYRNKKWWELRVSAYQAVIEAISDLTHYYNRKYKAEIERGKISDEYEAELSRFWENSYHKVRKAADSGVFLFSKEVNMALKEFMDLQNEEHHTYFEYLDSYSGVAEKCLKTVVECANKDLRVRDSWL